MRFFHFMIIMAFAAGLQACGNLSRDDQNAAMPLLPDALAPRLRAGCEWKDRAFSLFSGSEYKAALRTQDCPPVAGIEEIDYAIKDGNTLTLTALVGNQQQSEPILYIFKRTSQTLSDFAETTIPAPMRGGSTCVITEKADGLLTITPANQNADLAQRCGRFGTTSPQWLFAADGDFVFVFEELAALTFYDPASITITRQ